MSVLDRQIESGSWFPREWFWRRFYIEDKSDVPKIVEFCRHCLIGSFSLGYPFHVLGPYRKDEEPHYAYYDLRIVYSPELDEVLDTAPDTGLETKDYPLTLFYEMYSERFSDEEIRLILSMLWTFNIWMLSGTRLLSADLNKTMREMFHLITFTSGRADFPFFAWTTALTTGYISDDYKYRRRILYYLTRGLIWIAERLGLGCPYRGEYDYFLLHHE